MSKEIIRQLKSLKHAETGPSEEWLKRNRELLLSQIKNTVSPTGSKSHFTFSLDKFWQAASVLLPQALVYKVIRPVMTIALIMAMGVGSWVATVSASYEALPGDRLYSAKRVIEKTQAAVVNVMGDKNEVAKLHIEFAKRRAIETSGLVSQNDPAKVQITAQTVNELKDEMKTINNKLEEIKTTANTGAEAVKDINKDAQEIKEVLTKVKNNLLVNDVASTGDLSNQVLEAKNLVKETAAKAVEVMVEKHLQGDVTVSKDEVKEAINKQLQSAVTDAAASKQSMVEVNKVVGIVKTEMNAAMVQDIKNSLITNNTQALSDKIEETSKQTQAAVNATQQFNVETGQTVNEGQILLSQGNLSQAVDKIKEANAVSTQVEKITDDTLKAVQGILPVVAVVTDTQYMASSSATSTIPASSSLNIGVSVSGTIKINASTTPIIIVPKATTTIIKQ